MLFQFGKSQDPLISVIIFQENLTFQILCFYLSSHKLSSLIFVFVTHSRVYL